MVPLFARTVAEDLATISDFGFTDALDKVRVAFLIIARAERLRRLILEVPTFEDGRKSVFLSVNTPRLHELRRELGFLSHVGSPGDWRKQEQI